MSSSVLQQMGLDICGHDHVNSHIHHMSYVALNVMHLAIDKMMTMSLDNCNTSKAILGKLSGYKFCNSYV
jgi:hypothetical protein